MADGWRNLGVIYCWLRLFCILEYRKNDDDTLERLQEKNQPQLQPRLCRDWRDRKLLEKYAIFNHNDVFIASLFNCVTSVTAFDYV